MTAKAPPPDIATELVALVKERRRLKARVRSGRSDPAALARVDDEIERVMRRAVGVVPADVSTQALGIYLQAQTLAQDAVRDGYEPHAVAEGLLCGAHAVLLDAGEFWTVFERFKALHGQP